MYNLYSCGCIADGDVPILSRCGEHNGTVVAAVRNQVTKRRSFKTDSMHIRHYPLLETLDALKEKNITFDFICGYPEHGDFFAYNALESGWAKRSVPAIPKIVDALTEDGHLLLVIEQALLSRVIYDCLMAGLHLNSVSIVSSKISYEPYHEKWPEFYVYKFAVLFSKEHSDTMLPEYKQLAKLHKTVKRLLEPRRVFDISCIHTPFLHIASQRTLGVCENYNRYSKLKRELCT